MRPSPSLFQRPLSERGRHRTFLATAFVLALAAIALTIADRPDDAPAPTPRTSVSQPEVAVTQPAPAPVPRSPRSVRPPRRVTATAQRFLAGYLPYLYGRGRVRSIRGASQELRQRLARERLRVPPAARRRRPTVVGLRGQRIAGTSPAAWVLTARVADGSGPAFPIELLIARRDGRSAVLRIGGE